MIDETRGLLRARQALLVHFNTPMTHHPVGYPDDLADAIQNPGWHMCYSTVQATDIPPSTLVSPTDATACGHVGMVVDLEAKTVLHGVSATDAGSYGRGSSPGSALSTDSATCEAALNRKAGHDEWVLSHVRPIGIFLFENPAAFFTGNGEIPIAWNTIVADFPGQRIFTTAKGRFWEWSRHLVQWVIVEYDDIISP